jgi:catechol 2,3-dioxygenase-like lactoylglutathione lyase family enzyme
MDVLGLTEGWRPDFPFGGAWLYAGTGAVVHLVELPQARGPSREAALDHFAFSIDDYDGTLERLKAHGLRYQAVDIPNTPIRQINIRDLNGVNIELNYRPAQA